MTLDTYFFTATDGQQAMAKVGDNVFKREPCIGDNEVLVEWETMTKYWGELLTIRVNEEQARRQAERQTAR